MSKYGLYFKLIASQSVVQAGAVIANRFVDSAIDATMDITQDYIYSKVQSAMGNSFDSPWLKSFMSSFTMGCASDASGICMGMAMKTNMKIQSKIDGVRDKINDKYNKQKAEALANIKNKKARNLLSSQFEDMRDKELRQLDSQSQGLYSAVNGAPVSAGAYQQSLGATKSAFQSTTQSPIFYDPNTIKLLNGMGYFPDRPTNSGGVL